MKQKEWDFEKRGGVIPFAPQVSPPEAQVRLSRQCRMILTRLQNGPAYNGELAKMALKYTQRISEIREKGYRIEAKSVDAKTGLWVYTLLEGGN